MNIIDCKKCGNYTMEDDQGRIYFEGLCPNCKADLMNEAVERSACEAIEGFTSAITTFYDEHERGEEPTLSTFRKMQISCCEFFDLVIPVQ